MGQKVNPIGFRLGVNRSWDSVWYQNPKHYTKTLIEDFQIRNFLSTFKDIKEADVSKVEISRNPQRITVILHTSRPAILIGKSGANIDLLVKSITSLLAKNGTTGKKVIIKVLEVAKPQADAQHISLNIANSIIARGSYKRALKKAVQDAKREGVKGIKIRVSGRLNGAEIARSDSIKVGRVPLHTLRSSIDYGFTPAVTSYGVIGIKVWVYNGEILGSKSTSKKDDAGSIMKKKPRATSKSTAQTLTTENKEEA